MSKLIALDAGHSMFTAGKRTPTLPNGEKSPETGKNFMHENEFNRAVIKYLDVELRRCGFKTIFVNDTTGRVDTPLATRVRTANNAKADLYVSAHANANAGKMGAHGGIETFVYPSGESKRIGTLIHNELIQGTKLRDRGVKNGSNFYVVNSTKMPAVLVECGFMDSLTDYKYLLEDAYRKECAIEICKGICKAYNVTYIAEVKKASNEKAPTPTPTPPTPHTNTTNNGIVKEGIIEIIADTQLRAMASSSSTAIRTLKKGQRYKCYRLENAMFNLGSGWVTASSKHVRFIPNNIGNVEILASSLNIRKDSNLSSSIVGVALKRQKFPIYEIKNNMYRIGDNKWISASTKYSKRV